MTTATLDDFKAGSNTPLSISEFLSRVVTAPEGYFCLAIFSPETGWKEEWYKWPNQLEQIVVRALDASVNGFNVYYSSYLFRMPRSTKDNVLPSRTIQADLDNASIDILPLDPSFLVETSPQRYQAYWILAEDQQQDLDTHERFSHRITYNIEQCDCSGWPLGRKVRLPGTNNYKYSTTGNIVELRSIGRANYHASDFELLPEVRPYVSSDRPTSDMNFVDHPPTIDIGPQELFHSVKNKLDAGTVPFFNTKHADRSAALWGLTMGLFRIGMPKEQVYWITRASENNKFLDQRYHADRNLACDIIRAERDYLSDRVNVRELIAQIRKRKATAHEKNAAIQDVILENLRLDGNFYRTSEDNLWYIRNDYTLPVDISTHSDRLNLLLDRQFGVNAADSEAQYMCNGLYAFSKVDVPVNAERETLSYYNEDDRSLLLHSGTRDVYRITPRHIEKVRNGSSGIVFPWRQQPDPFTLDIAFNARHNLDWSSLMFGESVKNVIDMSPDEAQTLLSVWLLFVLFKNASISRPILALFGQPGSGKSTTFRCIYALLYGKLESLSGISTPDSYDYSCSQYPVLVLDNVDTWERWLPDRLAQSAAKSNITKRKLYTDTDTVTFKREAMIGITAHSPKFGRADVADRLLIIELNRLTSFRPEGELVTRVLKCRHLIWSAIAKDVQRILATPMPPSDEVPQFRIEDFAQFGYWIAKALGKGELFRSAIKRVTSEQKQFVLAAENILIGAIDKYIQRSPHVDEFRVIGALWMDLESYADDPLAFVRIYKNSNELSNKLWILQHSLKERYDVAFDRDNGRLWRIRALSQSPDSEVSSNGRET